MSSEIQFELSHPVKYDIGGEQADGKFITLTAPSKKQMENNIALKQAFFNAINASRSGSGTSDGPQDAKISGADVIDMMYMSGADMFKVLLSAMELFKSGVALIEGTEKVTQPILDKMNQENLEGMTGEYIVNFTIASFLKRQESLQATI